MSDRLEFKATGLSWADCPGWLLKAVRTANGGRPPGGFWIDPQHQGPGLRVIIDGAAHILTPD